MSRLEPALRRQNKGPATPERDGALPIRWAVIIIAALGGGFAIGFLVGPVEGITVGLAIAGLLHRVLPRS
jgi:hypothetical protein